MIKVLLLDLDGVVVDWAQGAIERLGLDARYHDLVSYRAVEDLYRQQFPDKSMDQFWAAQDEDFWMGLKMYPWAEELLDLLEPHKPVICTAPTITSAGWRQKWINKYMNKYFREGRYLIGPAKWAAAHADSMLIDDSPENLRKFKAAGGQTMFFPQPWNMGVLEDRYGLFKRAWDIVRETQEVLVKT